MSVILPLLLWALAGPAAVAGAVPPGPEEGLAGASRELDLIRAAREPALQGRPAGMSLPEPTAPSRETPLRPPTPAPPAPPLRRERTPSTGGWLLEAMERQERANRDRSRSVRSPRAAEPAGQGRETADDGEDQEQVQRPPGKDTSPPGAQAAGETPNVFQPFLAAWLTPSDLQLLRPVLEDAGRTREPGELTPVSAAGPGPVGGLREPARAPVSAPESRTRTNPYLEAMLSSAAPIPPATPPSPLAREPVPVVGPRPEAAPPPPAVRDRIPEFVKPRTDERLFGPLKRF